MKEPYEKGLIREPLGLEPYALITFRNKSSGVACL